jgi:hypothetical protein
VPRIAVVSVGYLWGGSRTRTCGIFVGLAGSPGGRASWAFRGLVPSSEGGLAARPWDRWIRPTRSQVDQARSTAAAGPAARRVSGGPARRLSWRQQPPSVLLSSHTHDRQAAALRKIASPRRAQAQVKARMAAAVLGLAIPSFRTFAQEIRSSCSHRQYRMPTGKHGYQCEVAQVRRSRAARRAWDCKVADLGVGGPAGTRRRALRLAG